MKTSWGWWWWTMAKDMLSTSMKTMVEFQNKDGGPILANWVL